MGAEVVKVVAVEVTVYHLDSGEIRDTKARMNSSLGLDLIRDADLIRCASEDALESALRHVKREADHRETEKP